MKIKFILFIVFISSICSTKAEEGMLIPSLIKAFESDDGGTYVTPQILTDVDHNMRIMKDETFGPVVCIMPVANDDEAVALMNDSEFGLTASLWTENGFEF